MEDPVLNFGIYKGKPISTVPANYIRWLADPERSVGKERQTYKSIPENIVIAAREQLILIDEAKTRENFVYACMGGKPTGLEKCVYIIETQGDCYSRSGESAINYKLFDSLDEALACVAEEFPIEEENEPGQETLFIRSTPDPEHDSIEIWEVLPSGHRKVVWGFFGWHHNEKSETYDCGQGKLPGDEATLYSLASQ